MNRLEFMLMIFPASATTATVETVAAEKLTTKWLGRICFMRNVDIDGEKYELPDYEDNEAGWSDVGLRSDGFVVWRDVKKRKRGKP
ncbi:hypothetical protein D4S03_10500 [bacterium]|nr:MAG: hypothetical protein D4S03_10500 [bacterium]